MSSIPFEATDRSRSVDIQVAYDSDNEDQVSNLNHNSSESCSLDEDDVEEISSCIENDTTFSGELLSVPAMMEGGWIPLQARAVQALLRDKRETRKNPVLDILAVLLETVGGVDRLDGQWWEENFVLRTSLRLSSLPLQVHDLTVVYHWALPTLLSLLGMISSPAHGPSDYRSTSTCSSDVCQISFMSSFSMERTVVGFSLHGPSEDLIQVMRIALPHFSVMNTRNEALSKIRTVGYSYSSQSRSTFGPTTGISSNMIVCLDVAESVSKLIPIVGDVLEGACGILRKIVQVAESARAARDECKALAEHTACIMIAIISEIGWTATPSSAELKTICDLVAILEDVNQRIHSFSKLGNLKYFVYREKINAEVKELHARVDNARIAFRIRNDISTTQLLHDLRRMQTTLMSRVGDLYEGQKLTHSKLDMILVQMRAQDRGVVGMGRFPMMSKLG
ncbi:hypothetical protein BDZ89DRAFT_1147799 [Hymenopellis radicata]|nr:hypothetical protein BDZ89DRAFT_1147799 [Hymenopellis radicata]